MDKILFFSDVHGNMPAVRAFEKEIERIKPDVIWFLGDAVGKGPQSDETLDWVREHSTYCLQGNWDESIARNFRSGEFPLNQYFYDQLGEERVTWIESLPFESEILISGNLFRLVHGRPTDRLYQAYDTWEELLQGFESNVSNHVFQGYICADSHMPYFRTCQKGYAINTGSIGNSLGVPRAHAILIEGELNSTKLGPISCNILSIPYDNEETIRIAESIGDFPAKEAWIHEIRTGIYSR